MQNDNGKEKSPKLDDEIGPTREKGPTKGRTIPPPLPSKQIPIQPKPVALNKPMNSKGAMSKPKEKVSISYICRLHMFSFFLGQLFFLFRILLFLSNVYETFYMHIFCRSCLMYIRAVVPHLGNSYLHT